MWIKKEKDPIQDYWTELNKQIEAEFATPKMKLESARILVDTWQTLVDVFSDEQIAEMESLISESVKCDWGDSQVMFDRDFKIAIAKGYDGRQMNLNTGKLIL